MHKEIERIINLEHSGLKDRSTPELKADYIWSKYPVCLRYLGVGPEELTEYFKGLK